MNLTNVNLDSNRLWFRDNGNNTYAINYDLNENSVVVDLGGYLGVWASQIINKYNCYLYLFEPIPQFYNQLVDKFKDNNKVKVFNFGISTKKYEDILYLNGDGTSKYLKNNNGVSVLFVTIQDLFNLIGTNEIDLIQINIEGEEFDLLDHILDNNFINSIKNIQVQFHTYVDDAWDRRLTIQDKLSQNYNKLYDYPFVFEGWKKK